MYTKADSLNMMRNQSSWPCWPFLPIKKRKEGGGWPDLAVLFYEHDKPMVAKDCTIYDDFNKLLEHKEEANLAALVAEGWEVD